MGYLNGVNDALIVCVVSQSIPFHASLQRILNVPPKGYSYTLVAYYIGGWTAQYFLSNNRTKVYCSLPPWHCMFWSQRGWKFWKVYGLNRSATNTVRMALWFELMINEPGLTGVGVDNITVVWEWIPLAARVSFQRRFHFNLSLPGISGRVWLIYNSWMFSGAFFDRRIHVNNYPTPIPTFLASSLGSVPCVFF